LPVPFPKVPELGRAGSRFDDAAAGAALPCVAAAGFGAGVADFAVAAGAVAAERLRGFTSGSGFGAAAAAVTADVEAAPAATRDHSRRRRPRPIRRRRRTSRTRRRRRRHGGRPATAVCLSHYHHVMQCKQFANKTSASRPAP
jgi:hypothetical protein